MLVAGIDLSTRALDVVTIPFDQDADLPPVWTHVPLADQDPSGLAWFYVCRRVRERIRNRVDFDEIVLVAVERPMGHAQILLPLFGAITAAIPAHCAVVFEPPQTWRKVTLGKGNATKDDAVEWALDHGAGRDWNDHACEAFGLAWAVRELNRQAIERNAA